MPTWLSVFQESKLGLLHKVPISTSLLMFSEKSLFKTLSFICLKNSLLAHSRTKLNVLWT